jgi:hypothetical protein
MGRAKLRSMTAVALGKLRSLLTLALVLWCAGAGCMIVSYAHAARMNGSYASARSVVRGPAPGSMETHHCCKSRRALERHVSPWQTAQALPSEFFVNLELAESPNSSSVMSCCPLTSGSIVANGNSRISNDDASELLDVDAASSAQNGFATTPQASSLRLPNQSHTYLRGCVFLI